MPASAATGVYARRVAPVMSLHETPSSDRCHFRRLPWSREPSWSISVAVISTPTSATSALSTTVPGSSAFVTRIVTTAVSASSPSLASTVTVYNVSPLS